MTMALAFGVVALEGPTDADGRRGMPQEWYCVSRSRKLSLLAVKRLVFELRNIDERKNRRNIDP